MIKKIIRFILIKAKLYNKIRNYLLKIGFLKEPVILYKIGNMKQHNAQIDTLIPQMVEIGDNFVAAPGAIITAHDASTFIHTGKYRIERVKIGDNVFLGANAVVLPGVHIADNVIVGAGAVVTKDVPSNSVVAGNPARILCSIQDYFGKCEQKRILYIAPESFKKVFQGIPLKKPDDIIEFQKFVIEQIKEREK